jgi:2-C-methyl-D-erythritol 4-phosphate cytidylyltransferase
MGKKIALLKNDDWNLKVTFPHDLELAEHVLELRAKKTAKSPKARAITR